MAINLTPLIDTALTLLVIFMITAPMLQHGIKVELPKGKAQEVAAANQALVLFIDKDERLFFNDTSIKNETDLIAAIKKELVAYNDKTLYVKADASIRYGKVIEMVDRMKFIRGIEHVALATQKRA